MKMNTLGCKTVNEACLRTFVNWHSDLRLGAKHRKKFNINDLSVRQQDFEMASSTRSPEKS